LAVGKKQSSFATSFTGATENKVLLRYLLRWSYGGQGKLWRAKSSSTKAAEDKFGM